MKKCLKNIPEPRAAKEDTPEGSAPAASGAEKRSPSAKTALIALTAEQRAFVKTLNDELKKFNEFFMNAEEDLVMRERVLGTRFHKLVDKETGKLAATASLSENATMHELKDATKAFADFHGELVLLEHWTSLNYTALVKILKKHDKRSGSLRLRSPFLVSALQQPFYSTEVLTQLIKKTEARFRQLHELTSEAEEAERKRSGATASPSRRNAQTPAALARTRAAILCWDGMKDEDSVKRPFGDASRFSSLTSLTPEPASKRCAGTA